MQVRLKIAATKLVYEPLPGTGLPSPPSLIVSAILHGMVAVGLGLITFSAPPQKPTPQSGIARPTVIRIGDRLYLVSAISAAARPHLTAPIRREASRREAAKTASTKKRATETAARRSPLPGELAPVIRAFVPPEVRKSPATDATLIQLLSPPDLVPVAPPLPSFLVWTAQLEAPKTPKPFLDPGQRTPSADAPALDMPSPEITPDPAPHLPAGDPVNILSLNDLPVPPTDKLLVPPGNMAGRLGENSGGGSLSAPGDRGSATSGSAANAPGSRVIVRPSNGNFDAVVIQTSPLDQFPESKGLLTGRPIYSVYISVETAKDWTLYFALPGERVAADAGTHLVQLESVAPVQAPYPTRLVRPSIIVPSYYKYILVHGQVNAAGRFEDLRVIRPIKPETDEDVIASLSGWEFRAATKDGVNVAVEFLLSIPVSGL